MLWKCPHCKKPSVVNRKETEEMSYIIVACEHVATLEGTIKGNLHDTLPVQS